MKRWIFIFVATVIVSKLMASAMLSLMPETTHEIIEKISSVNKVFAPSVIEKPIVPEKIIAPKVVLPTKAFLAYNKAIPLVTPAPVKKISSAAADAHEEKARRKKRKKKLEDAASKKKSPELTVIKVGASDNKRLEVAPISHGPINVAFVPADQKDKADNATSAATTAAPKVNLAEWAAKLTTKPTSADAKAFLALYKSGQITSHDYYSVMSLMQKSANKEARRLAVVGSSMEPNPEAFQVLVREKYNEKEADVQALATTRLQVYKDVKYLGLLTQPMMSGDVYAKTEASDLIRQIAQGLGTTPKALTADTKLWFTRFVAILTPMTKDASQASLQASATQTLSILHTILG